MQLTAAACDWVVRAIEWSRRQPRRALREALATRQERIDRGWDRRADDLLDDSGPAFGGADFVSV